MKLKIITLLLTFAFLCGIVANSLASRAIASYTVPDGVTQVKVTYVKVDNTVIFDRVIDVEPESKFTIRPIK